MSEKTPIEQDGRPIRPCCAYCGEVYGETVATKEDAARVGREHIEKCPKHPLAEARETIREGEPQ